MAYIGTPPSNAFTSLLKQDFSTSATTGYTLDHAVNNANDIALFINFVRQEPTAAYSASGTTLTLTSATASSDDMYCVYLGQALQTVNPPNASVGLSQLTATGTKDATTFLRGDNTFAEAGGGKILQVVTANETANRSITSTSYVNSSNGLTVDITPSATSSKIFIAVSITKFKAPSGQAIFLTVYRDSSNIGGSSGLALNGGFNESIPASFSIMDSPSSTSSLTYQVYAKTSGGTSEYGDGSGISTITAFEIGA